MKIFLIVIFKACTWLLLFSLDIVVLLQKRVLNEVMGKKIKKFVEGKNYESDNHCQGLILGAIYSLQFKRMSLISNKRLSGEGHLKEY